MSRNAVLAICLSILGLPVPLLRTEGAEPSPVKVYERPTVIPTYLAGEPEKSPMFYFGRQSQGAEGRIYPYPLFDTLTGKKVDKSYRLIYLENEYVKVAILPEIGGRLFEALDKTNGYHFFYRQHVIKPALIGLIGAWISGGIEWNIPHHHRASTFLPVQYRVEEGEDGSKTIWIGELELRHRMRWAVGYTLHPGKSYLEAKIRIVNRTPLVNTMLCFANAAVHATQDYQVIFPPGTRYVTHHHKREFTTWPIATTRYGGYDFRPATDVSFFRNHIGANSMFAWNYEDDFFAGYDHGTRAGVMSVADHRIVPGKKLWTWGNGPRGRMWDRILTDADGPYIELMVGAYSDNQPDYSWLQPFEAKSFSVYWYPFREIGGVKKANLDAAVNLEAGDDRKVKLGFCTTAAHPRAIVRLQSGFRTLLKQEIAIAPGKPYVTELSLPPDADPKHLQAQLVVDGKLLVEYIDAESQTPPMPSPDRRPPLPAEVKSIEELYLTGLRIEQFHDPDQDPEPFWEEALKRDPGEARVHTALGIRDLKRARYSSAEAHFRKAIERLTTGYATPEDGKAQYYLGLTLKALDRDQEAGEVLGKATWSAAWHAPAHFEMAELAVRRGAFPRALEELDRSLESNSLNLRAWNLKATVLRRLGRRDEALQSLAAAHRIDPLDARTLAERWLLTRQNAEADALRTTLFEHPANATETAAEYQSAGLWEDGLAVLSLIADGPSDRGKLAPLVYYDIAYFAGRIGQERDAAEARGQAWKSSPDRVFPFQDEAIAVLRDAIRHDPSDPRAPYYLGNLLFDWQPEEAVKLWKTAAELDPTFPMVHRNLAIAWSSRPTGNDLGKAVAALEKAVSLPGASPLHFAELDELAQAAGKAPEPRLKVLEEHQEVVATRAEALSREISLLILAGRLDEAIRWMTGRRFEVWEGGSLSVADDWVNAHMLRTRRHRQAGKLQEALSDLQAASQIPENLPNDQGDDGSRSAEIAYERGLIHEAQGDATKAKASWEEAAKGAGTARRRRSGSTDPARFYQAQAMVKLGRAEAEEIFRSLAETGRNVVEAAPKIDSQSSASVQQSQRHRLAQAHYLAGLGLTGLGKPDEARREFSECLRISPDHMGAKAAIQVPSESRGPGRP